MEMDDIIQQKIRRCSAVFLQTNAYRLGLITHLQAASVPLKDLSCLRDLERLIETATVSDVMGAYHQLAVDDSSLYTCIGTSGPEPLPDLPTLPAADTAPGAQEVISNPFLVRPHDTRM